MRYIDTASPVCGKRVVLEVMRYQGQRPYQYERYAPMIDSGWEGYHESRRCSRDTYPESYITKYTSIRK